MYIAPGQGQTIPRVQNFDVDINCWSLCPFVASLKKISLKSDFLTFLCFFFCFFFFSHLHSPRQGQTTHRGQKIYDNRKAFSLCPYVASFKMVSLKSDFMHICNDFIHVYSPRARTENPLETNFWCQQKALITSTIYCKFQTNLLEFLFYTNCFNVFQNVYSHRAGADNPCGQYSDVNRKALSLCPLLQVSKKYLWSLILYIFCLFLYMYISPGKGRQPPGIRILL